MKGVPTDVLATAARQLAGRRGRDRRFAHGQDAAAQDPQRACVLSGKTASLAPTAAASPRAASARPRLTAGSELIGTWQSATRMFAAWGTKCRGVSEIRREGPPARSPQPFQGPGYRPARCRRGRTPGRGRAAGGVSAIHALAPTRLVATQVSPVPGRDPGENRDAVGWAASPPPLSPARSSRGAARPGAGPPSGRSLARWRPAAGRAAACARPRTAA